MGDKHYNLIKERVPCSIIVDEGRYIYADYHTTAAHERVLREINNLWEMHEKYQHTEVADTDGGCDQIVEIPYTHALSMENAIFENNEIVGFYFEYESYNGDSSKPNAHVFMLDDAASLVHYNTPSSWHLMKK